VFLFLIVTSTVSAQPVLTDLAGLTTIINPACADFRILGPCSCTGIQVDQVCQRVEYHQPAYLVETVPIPGDTALGGDLISPGVLLGTVTDGASLGFAGGSGASPQESGHAQLTFREAHVYGIPTLLPFGCHACDRRAVSEDATLRVHYVSELDGPAWRYLPDGAATPLPLAALTRAGVWGALFPRHGFTQHDSPPVGAALLAWRALTIAFDPAPGPGGFTPHIVLDPATGVPPTCFQCGYPTLSRCGTVGMNPLHWQLEKVEARGRNLFVFWEKKTCCVDPATAACGVAMSAGNLDNFCPLGYDPVTALVPGMPPDVPFDGH
jgi:hypothetical protein